MKKIKSIQELKNEKNRIAQAQVDLLSKIKNNWHELKWSLHPRDLSKGKLEQVMNDKADIGVYSESILKKSFTYALILIVEKLADKISNKLEGIIKK